MKEPVGLFRVDRKRLDCLTLVPWQSDTRFLCSDVKSDSPRTESYVNGAAREAETAAEVVASRKKSNYAEVKELYCVLERRHLVKLLVVCRKAVS